MVWPFTKKEKPPVEDLITLIKNMNDPEEIVFEEIPEMVEIETAPIQESPLTSQLSVLLNNAKRLGERDNTTLDILGAIGRALAGAGRTDSWGRFIPFRDIYSDELINMRNRRLAQESQGSQTLLPTSLLDIPSPVAGDTQENQELKRALLENYVKNNNLEDVYSMAQQVSTGDAFLKQVPAKNRVKVAELAQKLNPNFNPRKNDELAAVTARYRGPSGARNIRAFHLALDHLRTMDELAERLAAGKFPTMNAGINWLKKEVGSADPVVAKNLAALMGSELASYIAGSLVVPQALRNKFEALFDTNLSPAQLKASIAAVSNDFRNAYRHDYESLKNLGATDDQMRSLGFTPEKMEELNNMANISRHLNKKKSLSDKEQQEIEDFYKRNKAKKDG